MVRVHTLLRAACVAIAVAASAAHAQEAGVDENLPEAVVAQDEPVAAARKLQLLTLGDSSSDGLGLNVPGVVDATVGPATDAPTPAPETPAPTTAEPTTPAPTTAEPTPEPTTAVPTTTPEPTTVAPTTASTEAPTSTPTEAPTATPTEAPTEKPTEAPTATPTEAPTATPTEAPTEAPTATPTDAPTESPAPITLLPVDPITLLPTIAPVTEAPVETPSPPPVAPTAAPTEAPTTTAPPATLLPVDPVTEIPITPPPVTLEPVTSIPPIVDPTTPTSSPPPATETPSVTPPGDVTPQPATPAPPVTSIPPVVNPTTPTPSPPPVTDTPPLSPTPVTPGPSVNVTPVPSSGDGSGSAGSPPPPTRPPTDTPAPGPASPSPATTAPVTVVPVVVAIETNSPDVDSGSNKSKDDKATDAPVFDANNDAVDVIVFNPNKSANAPSVNPFEIKEITSITERPVVLDIDSTFGTTEAPKKYVRGQVEESVIDPSDSSGSSTKASTADAPNVIGGRKAYMPTDASAVLSSTSAAFHDFLRYSSVAFAGISVALLLFFHFVSLDSALFWTNPLWSPNTWEFLLYVGYLQQMASLSQLTLLKTPYFLWDFTDSFSWTNFLLETSSTSSASRRLETIVLGGVVSFADRIGVLETKILYHAVAGFTIICGVLLAIFLIGAIMAKRKAEESTEDFSTTVHRLRSTSIRTLGLCVLIWYFALFPLSLYASFEISMEISASAVGNALSIALISLVLVCFGVLAYSGRIIMHKSKEELQQFENMATWGSLYAEYTYRSRMFFIVGAVVQITTGILVGTMDSDPMQLIVLIGVHSLYLVAVFILRPFAESLVLYFTYALGMLKIVNFALAFSFLNSNTMSSTDRNHVADAFIGINTIVIVAWFVRQLVVFSTYIRVWMQRHEQQAPRNNEDSTAKYETRTATDSEVYASISTARAAGDPSDDGSSSSSSGLSQEQLHHHNNTNRPMSRNDMEAGF